MDQYQNMGGGRQNISTPTPMDSKKPVALIVFGIVLILALVAVGCYVFLGEKRVDNVGIENAEQTNTGVDPITTSLSTQGTSDDVADIDADLNATDLTSLNEIDQI